MNPKLNVVVSRHRNILFIGPSGGGKAHIIQALSGHATSCQIAECSMVHYPALQYSDGKNANFILDFFDSRDFCDDRMSFQSMTEDWNTLVRRQLTAIHLVVVVLPVGHVPNLTVQKYLRILVDWEMKAENCIVLLNTTEMLDETALAQYEQHFRSADFLPSQLRPTKVIATCFPDPVRLEEPQRSAAAVKAGESRDAVLQCLLTSDAIDPFKPMTIGRSSLSHALSDTRADRCVCSLFNCCVVALGMLCTGIVLQCLQIGEQPPQSM